MGISIQVGYTWIANRYAFTTSNCLTAAKSEEWPILRPGVHGDLACPVRGVKP
jgi:hypothetical protein